MPRPPSSNLTQICASVEVLFHDDALIVLNKPSGLLVHRGWARDRVTALDVARELAGRYVYPIHRLDRSASGVLVFALSGELARLGQEGLLAGAWQKHYLALVRGITPENGVVDYALAPEKGREKKEALSLYRRLGTFERYSLIEVEPKTGRLHQIRRHMRHLSHPLIGDVRYGKAEHNRIFRSRFALNRLCLHASRLRLPHPVLPDPIELFAPLPDDLRGPFNEMGLGVIVDRDARVFRSAQSSPP